MREPFHRSFHWYLVFVEIILGASLIWLFWVVEARAVRALFLTVGVWLVIRNLLRLVDVLVFPLPDISCKRLASSVSIILAGVFLLLHSQSIIALALFWIILLYGLIGGFQALQRLILDYLFLSMLLMAYKAGTHSKRTRNSVSSAFIYMLAEPGLAVIHGNRLCGKIVSSLMRHRKQRMIAFLTSNALHRYSEDFRRWVTKRAAALLIVRFPPGFADEKFESTIRDSCSNCLGQIFLITLCPKGYQAHETPEEFSNLALSANISSMSVDSFTQHKAIASLIDEMAMSTFPIAAADSQLPHDLWLLIPLIAEKGLPPVANSYLRYRLSRSDVERFLCLLDCVETLIKCSAIVLLTSCWYQGERKNSREIEAKLSRPSLGHWIEILRSLITSQAHGVLQDSIMEYWAQPLLEAPAKLIDDVSGSGLDWRGELPRSHLHWLDWFVWLRNVTRGHGTVKENFVANLWQGFHEVFLGMTLGLEKLVLCSTIQSQANSGMISELVGWQRTGRDPSKDPVILCPSPDDSHLFLQPPSLSARILLFPFVINYSGSVVLWNSVRGKSVEFINYGTGQLQLIASSETDPYSLWSQASQPIL